jgi:hypothetical protein
MTTALIAFIAGAMVGSMLGVVLMAIIASGADRRPIDDVEQQRALRGRMTDIRDRSIK